jgi:hypothetical protein
MFADGDSSHPVTGQQSAADRVFPAAVTLAPPPAVHAVRSPSPAGEADRRSRRRERAARTLARKIRMPPVSSICPGRRWTTALDHPAGRSRQTAMLGNVAVEPAGTIRSPERRRMRLPGTSVSLPGITLSDKRGQGERARTRRSGRIGGAAGWPSVSHRNGRSVRESGSHAVHDAGYPGLGVRRVHGPMAHAADAPFTRGGGWCARKSGQDPARGPVSASRGSRLRGARI